MPPLWSPAVRFVLLMSHLKRRQFVPTDTDEAIQTRLGASPARSGGRTTATALVRRHYDAIAAALMKDRHERKTWEEIGRDLRPLDPIPADTVGKAFARVAAERGGKAASSVTERIASPAKPIMPSVTSEAPPSALSKNPFAHRIDPVRLGKGEA
jgi:hypothetical protein